MIGGEIGTVPHDTGRPRKPWYRQQYVYIIAAAILGSLVGWRYPGIGTDLKPLGDAFISLLTMTIAPLIFLVVVTGIAQAGDIRSVGRMGARAFVYFEIGTTLCLLLGAVVAAVVRPGDGVAQPSAAVAAVASKYAGVHANNFAGFLANLIPETFVGAFAKGAVLQVLVLAVLCGVGLLMMGESRHKLTQTFDQLTQLIFSVVNIVVLAAPIGVFGAMAFTVGKFGAGTISALLVLVLTAWGALALFVIVGLGLTCRAVGIRLMDLLHLLRDEMLFVIGTSSSETALPGMLRKLPLAGVPRAVTGLVVPAGYSFNLTGVAITLPLSVMFIAQVYGIRLSLAQQAGIFILMLFTSKGAAGVTGGAFGALAATVVATGVVPVEGLALLLGIDRFMSLGRAVVNTLGNAVAAVAIARWEGDFDQAAWASAVTQARARTGAKPQPTDGCEDLYTGIQISKTNAGQDHK
jgi:aerobic C4-dicarboxylate transport protein